MSPVEKPTQAEAYRLGQSHMRERAAKVCDERGAEEQEAFGLGRGTQNYFRARNAVRDLPLEPLAADQAARTTTTEGGGGFAAWLKTQRSIPTMDPPWSAAWNACLDHVERHLLATLPATPAGGGWIVANGAGDRWRCWSDFGSDWTDDREKATRYHRREDAEAVHAGDEDAWSVTPYRAALDLPAQAAEVGHG